MTLACTLVGWLSCRALGTGLSSHTVGAQVGRLFCSLLAKKPLWQ